MKMRHHGQTQKLKNVFRSAAVVATLMVSGVGCGQIEFEKKLAATPLTHYEEFQSQDVEWCKKSSTDEFGLDSISFRSCVADAERKHKLNLIYCKEAENKVQCIQDRREEVNRIYAICGALQVIVLGIFAIAAAYLLFRDGRGESNAKTS